jgi:HK97 family phage major capsid protein
MTTAATGAADTDAKTTGTETPDAELRSAEDIRARMRSLVPADEATAMPDEDVTRYEALEAKLASLANTVDIRSREAAYDTPAIPGASKLAKRSAAAKVANADKPGPRFDAAFHAAEREDRNEDGSEGFIAYLRSGDPNADLMEFRAQAEASGPAGGYLVPEGFRGKIVERMKAFGGLQAVAENITTTTGNPLPWPKFDDTAEQGEIVAEGAAGTTGADLVFDVDTLGAYRYNSAGPSGVPLKISWELLQDSAFDIEGKVAGALGRRIARKFAAHLASGTGVGQPQGLLVGGTSSDEIASNATGISWAELVAATHVPDAAYREMGNCGWIMHDAILGVIEALVDGNGRPLLLNAMDPISQKPYRSLLGYPVTIDNSFPSSWGDQAKTIAFGDFTEGYVVRHVKDIALVVLKELYAPNGQLGYMAWARGDGRVQNVNAYTVISGQNT